MPRLQIVELPRTLAPFAKTPFAFILDHTNPMTEAAIAAWKGFAEKCGARDIIITAETIDIDPETSDGWEPDDDEPADYFAADHTHNGCEGHSVPEFIVNLVKTANDEAWEKWEPENLDPGSPRILTHRKDACSSLVGDQRGCPMHDPMLDGPWAAWPYWADRNSDVLTRICDHGISHPTPEEYAGGFDTPHLCDGCECAPEEDRDRYTIVVSDLANTRLPRGTLLLGVKDDPTPVTAPPANVPDWVAKQDAYVGCGARYNTGIGSLGCKMPHGHEGNHTGGGVSWLNDGPDSADRTPAEWYAAPAVPDLAAENWGTATIQPLGADGEPVGEAKDYPLAGPVEVTEKEYGALTEGAGGETVNCFCGLPIDGHPDHGTEPDAMPTITANVHRVTDIAEEIEPVEKWATAEIAFTDIRPCGVGVLGAPCVLAKGHEGLHEFGQFNRV